MSAPISISPRNSPPSLINTSPIQRSVIEEEIPFLSCSPTRYLKSELHESLKASPPPSSQPLSVTTPSRISRRRRGRVRASDSCCQTFTDEYEMIEGQDGILGEGAYAAVRKFRHRISGKIYAVKIIDRNNPKNTREKVFHELRLLRRCASHKNILDFHQYCEDQDHWYMVFEFVEGGNLQGQIDKRNGVFSEEEAAHVISDLTKALEFLHENRIAHRDLKPANILCEKTTAPFSCKIADFDLACIKEKSKLHQRCSATSPVLLENESKSYHETRIDSGFGCSPPSMAMSMRYGSPPSKNLVEFEYEPMEMTSPVGTPEYMPPELATRFLEWSQSDMHDRVYNETCDVWSLGVIAYVLLAGEPPFKAIPCNNMDCKWNEGGCCEDCQESLLEDIISCNLSFASPKWDNISNEAKHFVMICLNRDFHVRVSAKELLKHPFVTKVQELSKSSNDAEEVDSHQKQEATSSLPAQISFAVSPSASAESQFLKTIPAVEKEHKLTLEELNDLTTFLNNQLNLASSSPSSCRHHQHSQNFYNTRRKDSILDELDIDSDSGLGTNHLENQHPDKHHFSHASKSEMFNKHRSYKIHTT